MQIIVDLFNLIFLGPIVNSLVAIMTALNSIGVPGSLGASIIILTILIRALLWPLMSSQLKSAKKMADLKPHIAELKNQHKDDKQAFAKAQMDLYKEHGINPAGGCLPTLIQLPILIALYQATISFFNGAAELKHINELLYIPSWKLVSAPDPYFLGINIAHKPSQFGEYGFLLLLVPVITGGLTFVQSKMMTPKPIKEYKTDSPKEKKEKESTEDMMGAVQSQMTILMPIMIGYFAFQFPIGLALYWNTITIFGIIQQYFISGWGSLEDLVTRNKRLAN